MTKNLSFFFGLMLLLIGCTTSNEPIFEETNPIPQNNFVPEQFFPNSNFPANKVIEEHEKNEQNCENKEIMFNTSPIALNELEMITPLGRMSGSHVTPTDHQYWGPINVQQGIKPIQGPNGPNAEMFKIMTPANGKITQIERFSNTDYRMEIQHSCDLFTIFIHIDKLNERIAKAANFDLTNSQHQSKQINLSITEGEILGSIGKHSFDFSVHDKKTILSRLLSPELYENEWWKIHTVDPFEYFTEPLKTQLIQKSLRTDFPIGGKIDYDIEGKIVGNWFKEESQGYKGSSARYEQGHLSIAFDHLDPTHITISIGDFEGQSKQFGVIGNSPNPETIGITKGITKYELTDYRYVKENGKDWDQVSFASNIKPKNFSVVGVILLELVQNRKLKVEVFPSKTSSQVEGFTNSAVFFER